MKNNLYIWFICSVFWLSCTSDSKKETTSDPNEIAQTTTLEEKDISFRYQMQGNSYPDAMLELHNPLENETFDVGAVPFEFNIKNYPFEHGRNGFQLRMIINGADPIGYNMPIFRKEFETGTYKVLAFLVDDDGMALKEYGNYVERDFVVGKSAPFPESDDPYIGVNLPENGTEYQAGEDVVVDYILVGGDLEEDGLRVKVTAEGQEFVTDELGVIYIDNLSNGSHKITIALVDGSGKELSGIFSKSIKEVVVK
ncbi:hypothetical protein FKX85_06975 [Echinicola soli]|uniref:Uncharacterized protein n=1 Tax=Echinicola soli TaxID=2591634 RepID=A0A514CG45_9BACT|nr:hypothetical protein [Echinicola soli]QDH78791.1 hypothetical protein FKX85_06975 [Echinicola soli]